MISIKAARVELKTAIRDVDQWIDSLPIQHAGNSRLWTNLEFLVDQLIDAAEYDARYDIDRLRDELREVLAERDALLVQVGKLRGQQGSTV